jgi:hypothetical protein
MKVIKEGKMPDGTDIQIEDWNENYDFYPYSSTIAVYTKSKWTLDGDFAPKAGELYRFQFNFNDAAETETAFDALLNGEKAFADYIDKLNNRKHAACI